MIDGRFLKCHGRVLDKLIGADKVVQFDALPFYKKYTDAIIGIDGLGSMSGDVDAELGASIRASPGLRSLVTLLVTSKSFFSGALVVSAMQGLTCRLAVDLKEWLRTSTVDHSGNWPKTVRRRNGVSPH